MPAAHVIVSGRTPALPSVVSLLAADVDAARLLGLRTVAESQGVFGGVLSVGPGDIYSAVFLRDYFYMAEVYPGFFTPAYMRPLLDQFMATIGGAPGFPDFPAEHIDPDGTARYRPGSLGDIGNYPVFDSAPYLTMLTKMVFDRGDRTVYGTYKAQMLQILAAAPRDGSGRIFSDPFQYTVGWGFEDLQTSGNQGGLGMATALHIMAYRDLAAMATAEGDTTTASTATTAANGLITALATLRRGDNYYNGCTSEPNPHVMLTALAVYNGWMSPTERLLSANALLTDYNAVSAFSGDPGSKGGNIAQRGGIRHLVYPNYFSAGSAPNFYQNGTAWLGPWTGWVAYALALLNPLKGNELMQSAVDEVTRQERVDGQAPWEWGYFNTRGSTNYGAAIGCVGLVKDTYPARSWVVSGANGSTETLRLPSGTQATRFRLTAAGSSTVTVELAAAKETNVLGDPVPIVAPTFGAESPLTTLALASSASQLVGEVPGGAALFGGYLRATVAVGSASGNLTVEALRTENVPSMAPFTPVPDILDDYSTDKLATDYFTTGIGWAVTGGRLQNTDPADAQGAVWKSAGAVADCDISVVVNSADMSSRFPSLIVRSDAAINNGVVAMVGGGFINIFDRVAGSMNQVGTGLVTTLSNTDYLLRVRIAGTTCEAYLDGVLIVTATVATVAAGYFGPYLGSVGGSTVTFDNLTSNPSSLPLARVPPGFVLTSDSRGFAPSDLPVPTTPTALRDPRGYPVAVGDGGTVLFSYDQVSGFKTASPVFNLPSPGVAGTFAGGTDVTMYSPTVGALIRYTLDGTTPTTASPVYTGPITIYATTTVKAFAQSPGNADSDIETAVYTITPAFFFDTFNQANGSAVDPSIWSVFFGTPPTIQGGLLEIGGAGSGGLGYNSYVIKSVPTLSAAAPFTAKVTVFPLWGSTGAGGAENIFDFALIDTVGGVAVSRELRGVVQDNGTILLFLADGFGIGLSTFLNNVPAEPNNRYDLVFDYDGAGLLSVTVNGAFFGPFAVVWTGPMQVQLDAAVTGTQPRFSYFDDLVVE
jgi:chitobiase/beta-hexosaminidase-like protein